MTLGLLVVEWGGRLVSPTTKMTPTRMENTIHAFSKGDVHVCSRNSLVILSNSEEMRSSSSQFWITLARLFQLKMGSIMKWEFSIFFNLGFFLL